MKKKYVLLPIMIGLSLPNWANSKPAFLSSAIDFEWKDLKQETIKGSVKTPNGSPIVGASITNLSTGKSTQTNADGAFEIAGTMGQNLKITMVGYHAQTLKIESNVLKVMLQESDQSLDEVVVVGYGRQKKVNLTGAVTQIDSKFLEDRPVANATQALQGAVPNVNVTFTNGRPGGGGNVIPTIVNINLGGSYTIKIAYCLMFSDCWGN